MIVFYKKRKRIVEDQVLRAHGRGEDPATNKNYGTRKMYGKMYFPYQPTKYWWALVVLGKKFFLVFFGMYFRNYPTFQMAITLFLVFLAFSFHVDNDPFLGMLEKAKIVREEAEETILREIKKLERAQLLVRINGKAYYQLMHTMRLQIDKQEEIMAKHAFSPFNYNVVESCLLMVSCIIVLAGIMFDSDYILEGILVEEYKIRGKVIAYLVLFLFVFSVIYYGVVFVHEFCVASKRRKTTRQLMWARIKANSSKIRGMGATVLAGHKKFNATKVAGSGPEPYELARSTAGALFQAKKASAGRMKQQQGGQKVGFNMAKVVPFQKVKSTMPSGTQGKAGESEDDGGMNFAVESSSTPLTVQSMQQHNAWGSLGKKNSAGASESSESSESSVSSASSVSSVSSSDEEDTVVGTDPNVGARKIDVMEILPTKSNVPTPAVKTEQAATKSSKKQPTAPVFGEDGKRVHQHQHHAKDKDGRKIHQHKHHDSKDGKVVHKHHHSAKHNAEADKKRKELEDDHSGSELSVSSGSSQSSVSSMSSGSSDSGNESGSTASGSDSDSGSDVETATKVVPKKKN